MRFAPHLVYLGLVSLASFACSSSSTTANVIVRPQLVAVDPDDFLGSVRCAPPLESDAGAEAAALAADPNAARSYVATLFDVTPAADGGVPDPGTPLASSPPTSCLKPVTFSWVTGGHRYVAEVDAYHERPEDLTPISAGSRLLSNPDGSRALPRWKATCGSYPPSPAIDGGSGSEAAGAAGTDDDTRPPGVVSYTTITQTPHDCGRGLQAPD